MGGQCPRALELKGAQERENKKENERKQSKRGNKEFWPPAFNSHDTVKPLNFARDLISLILQVMKIREIKYPRKFKFYIDSNSKASRFAKLSTYKDGCNLQFAKLSPREIKVFYSIWNVSIKIWCPQSWKEWNGATLNPFEI